MLRATRIEMNRLKISTVPRRLHRSSEPHRTYQTGTWNHHPMILITGAFLSPRTALLAITDK